MKKKIVLLAICLVVVFAFFSACGEEDKDTVVKPNEDGTYSDFGGEKFYFLGSFIVADPADEEDSDVEPGTLPYLESKEDEVLYNQCLYVEKTYNCKIIRRDYGGLDTAAFATAYAAGNVEADFGCATLAEFREYYGAGILEDLTTVKTIDYTDEAKWGINSKRDAGSYGGVLYAFPVKGSMYTPFITRYNGALIYNYELYDTFNVGSTPKEMVESGDWTFDNFITVVQQCSDLSAQRPIYGLENQCAIDNIALGANGTNVIVKKNGKYICGYGTDAAVNALEWVRRLNQTGCVCSDGEFDKGSAVFALKTSEAAINSECATVHWVPFPSGPDVEYLAGCGAYFGGGESCTAIFKHDEDPDRKNASGFLMDKLFAPTEEWGETGYDEYMSRNFFDTEDDYQVYKNATINMNYQYYLEIRDVKDLLDSTQSIVNSSIAAEFTGSIRNRLTELSRAYTDSVVKNLNESISK